MDYDDNDILRHNPQLAGEGISKSSSVLRPYDFPGFDFDDSLQGHLKFDSLVEPEVFLGIQSQEDNQWIEDFSRGSNGMEFNSAPADSCSIPRRDNVWSEATSSESVEMLLKSVGQEEKMIEQSYIKDSETCDDQGTVTNHVEYRSNLDGNNDVETGNSEATLPQDEFVKNNPLSEGELKEQLRDVEEPSAAAADVESTGIASGDLVHNVDFGKGWATKNEGNSSYSGGCSIENVQEMDLSNVKSTREAVEESLCHMETIDNTTTDLVALNDPADNCNNDKQDKHVSVGRREGDSKILKEKRDEDSLHMHSDYSGDENLNNVIEIVDNSVGTKSEMRSSLEEDGNGLILTSLQIEKQEIKNLPSTCEVDDRVEGCKHGSVVDGIHQHSGDLGSSNAPHCASPQQKMNSSEQLACTGNNDQMKGVPASPLKNESISAVPLFHIADNKVVGGKHDCSDDTSITESSDMVVLNPAVEFKQTNDVEGIHTNAEEPATHVPHVVDCSNLTNEENSDHIGTDFPETKHIHVPHVIDSSNLVNEENSDHMRTDFAETKQDMHLTKGHDESIPVEAGNADAEHIMMLKDDQRIESNKEVKESSPSPAPNDFTECELREPAVAGLSYSDNDPKEHATRIEPDVDLRTETDCVSKFEVSVADDVNKTLPAETVSVSSESMVKSNEVNSSVSPPIAEYRHEESNQSQVDLGNCRSLKDSTSSDFGSEKNHEPRKKADGEKDPAETSEVDKASCGSPTVITSCEPSEMSKDNQEQTKDSEITDKSVNDIQPSSEDPKRDDPMGDDTSFTFKVTALQDTTEGESRKCWSPVPIPGNCNSSVANEENTPAGQGKKARTTSQKTPRKNARVSHGENVTGSSKSKGTSERKGRRLSAKGAAKEIAKSSLAKGADLDVSSGIGDKPPDTFLRTSSLSNPNVQPCGPIELSGTKVSSADATLISNLPDLNTSTLSNSSCRSPSSRQAFTDSQQVQLRAQIFVYGSLIQGTAPDEACMVSAFGSSDGGRTVWEPAWRSAVERVRSQKSNVNTPETPLHSHSGLKPSDVTVKQSPHSSKLLPSPVSHSSSKGTPSPAVSPKIPLSPPLWSISTPFRDSLPSTGANKGPLVDYWHAATPMHSYQTPPIRNFVGHPSWPSHFPGPWIASPRTSPFSSTVCFQPVTMTETAKLTPQKETSGPVVSGAKRMTSSPTVQNVGPNPAYVGISPLPDQNRVSSAEKHSVEAKPRKRKKVPLPDPCQVSLVSEAQTEPLVVTTATHILSSAVVPASAGPSSDAVPGKVAMDASVVFSHDRSEKRDLKVQKAVSCSEETLAKVAEAKSEAEDAATVAAAAVKNSNDLWSELARQQDTGLTPEAEAKLAAAAVAIAAAASVTKAAAAAAEVAYHAALQAKLMADEAILSSRPSSSDGRCSNDPSDANAILKGDKVTNQSNSILVAAKEAAKRRIEAASAASKQAENLNAIVKAAELAATAVSQAGQIVAMGEPLPLRDLIEAGPDGCWKFTQPPCELDEIPLNRNREGSTVETEASAKVRVGSADKEGLKALIHRNSHSRRRPRKKLDSHVGVVNGVRGPEQSAEKGFTKEKDFELSDSLKYGVRVTESQAAPGTGVVQNDHEDVGVLHRHIIKEGSLVEVFKHEDGVQSAWYSANVIKVEDGKAYVCYSNLLSEKGSGNLCEWVPLECEGDKPPVIRAAVSLTASQSQVTRKRRRAALGHHAWSVGDRVDVWINDCWREGVITERDDKDETTLKVHFPAQGETSTVRAWDLRTSRLWTDGKWVEWTSAGQHAASEQSDTPQEKRRKMGSSAIPSKEMEKPATNVDYASARPEEAELGLSTSERVFDIGKTTNDDSGRATRKPLRTGQRKEGSRVVFGVPKPTGKKRKFMEVSKQFPTNRTDKMKEANDSVKFAKYLIPQTATSRGWKAPVRNVSQERRTTASRSRAPSSLKSTRTLTQKDTSTSTSAQDGNANNTSEKRAKHGFPEHDETAEAPLSSLLTTSKKMSSHARSERVNKGKLVSAGEKRSKIETEAPNDDSGKSVTEAGEPRRSNRRIQPTHRLLEGLQSSLIMPKMSFLAHDKRKS